MSDPRAVFNEAVIRALPRVQGTTGAVIFRHYDAPERPRMAETMIKTTQELGHLFIVAGDPLLAAKIGADGIHLPERQMGQLAELRVQYPQLIISAACHSREALLQSEGDGADCALLSPLFPTASHEDVEVLGIERFSDMIKGVEIPVIALGGITEINAAELLETDAAGLAAISALTSA